MHRVGVPRAVVIRHSAPVIVIQARLDHVEIHRRRLVARKARVSPGNAVRALLPQVRRRPYRVGCRYVELHVIAGKGAVTVRPRGHHDHGGIHPGHLFRAGVVRTVAVRHRTPVPV